MKYGLKLSIFLLIALFFVSGCASDSTISPWDEEDFAFYDENGKEVDFPSDGTIWLSDVNEEKNGDFQLKRGAKIGIRATTALKKYDLNNFYWDIGRWRSDTEEEEVADKKLKDEYQSPMDALEHMNDFVGEKEYLYIGGDFYENSKGELVLTERNKLSDLVGEVEITAFYSIGISIEDEKITEISVEKVEF